MAIPQRAQEISMKVKKSISIIAIIIGLTIALVWLMGRRETAVHAATFTVNSTVDAVDTNPGDGSCNTSGGVCTLRAAIQEANALPGLDNINLPNGNYLLSLTDTILDTDAFGDLDISDDLFLSGMIAQTTIVDAQQIDRVFAIPQGVNVTLAAITIQNGSAEYGAGISNFGSLNLMDTIVMNNNAVHTGFVGGGGGIYNNGNLTLSNSTIDANSSTEKGGGIFQSGTLTLVNSVVSNNTGYNGGGIAITSGVTDIQNSNITDNLSSSDYGGGIYNTGGLLTITDGELRNNTTNYMGGGIFLSASSKTAVIDGTTFINNMGQWGGALLVGNDNTQVEVTDAVFDNNSATSGGGAIHYYYAENTTLTITGSTFSDNSSASSGGGALRLDGNLMTLHISMLDRILQ